MSTKSIYNKKEWVLAVCTRCHKENYVEPHGMTAECVRCGKGGEWVEHESIPYDCRFKAGMLTMASLNVDMKKLRAEFPLLPVQRNAKT